MTAVLTQLGYDCRVEHGDEGRVYYSPPDSPSWRTLTVVEDESGVIDWGDIIRFVHK